MPSFTELVNKYQKQQNSALIDSISAGLSLADNVSVDLGLLGDSGLMNEALEALSLGLPFAIIALTEGGKVVLGKKTPTAAAQDAGFRAVKTGAALGAGALAAGLGLGALPAIPVAVGLRLTMEHYRSQALLGRRVELRTRRLKALRDQRESKPAFSPWEALPAQTESPV